MNDAATGILIKEVAGSPFLVAYLQANFQGTDASLAADLLSGKRGQCAEIDRIVRICGKLKTGPGLVA